MVRAHWLYFPGSTTGTEGNIFMDTLREVGIGVNSAKLGLNPILSLLSEGKLNQGPFDSETILGS